MGVLKTLTHLGAAMIALLLACSLAVWTWIKWETHLPSDQDARAKFSSQRSDYVRFVGLLRKDHTTTFVDGDGAASSEGGSPRVVPDYQLLMREIGAKSVLIRKDGSVEFVLWGLGCVICSDSYMGARYVPTAQSSKADPGWAQQLVPSLQDESLPKEDGRISDGLYVIPVEPEWFIYRLEIR